MPLPLLFIGVAAASGMFGIGGTVKAGVDAKNAKQINKSASELVQEATKYLNAQRLACGNALTHLGAEKVSVLNGTISDFLNVFTQIKNVDFKETEGLNELNRLHIDEHEFVELRAMANFAGSVAGGAIAETAGSALAAFGAYGAAQALAFASTGTAISALSGAAATNAPLAFFGGGSLAAGGLGTWRAEPLFLAVLWQVLRCWSWGLSPEKRRKKNWKKPVPIVPRLCGSQHSSTPLRCNVKRSAEEPMFFIICWLGWTLISCR